MCVPSRLELWADYLHSSRGVTNTVLGTGDGGHKATHAVILAGTSHLLAGIMEGRQEEEWQVILPDFTVLQVGGVVGYK